MRRSDTPLDELKRHVQSKGWKWQPGKTIPYGEQILIVGGSDRVSVNYYPKRHAMVPGGSASPLKAAVEAWIETRSSSFSATAAKPAKTPSPQPAFAFDEIAHIGMDESGKGDWFGPLVVAAVYLEPSDGARLRELGVRDSKVIAPGKLQRLAEEIKTLVPETHRHVRLLMPEEYNRRYAAILNLNRLLTEVYGETAAEVWPVTKPEIIFCDQFSNDPTLLNVAFGKHSLPAPLQQTRAESASTAVAAASVLATAAFSNAMAELGERARLDAPLPKGSSAVDALKRAVNEIMEREGAIGLGRYAKLHFKPIQELLNASV